MITKFLTSGLSLVFMVVGGLWTAYFTLTSMMDAKVATASEHIKVQTDAKIGVIGSKIDGVIELQRSMDKKLNILIEKEKR